MSKKLFLLCILVLVCLAATFSLHAQFAAQSISVSTPVSETPDSIVRLTAEAQGLELLSPAALPRTGTFWVVNSNGFFVPFPCPPRDGLLPTYGISGNIFLVDDTGGQVNAKPSRFQKQTTDNPLEFALAALAGSVADLIEQVQKTTLVKTLALAFGVGGLGAGGGGINLPMFCVADTNLLWLDITNYANGLAYVNLNNGTNFVYEILTKTNLLQPAWQFELALWPTNPVVMPFTVPVANRKDTLFIWARDWTTVDDNANGLPDWWEWKYFGYFGVNPNGDPDGDGMNNLQEYLTGNNPLQTRTQILAWGDNSFGECNVPPNLTNALAVAGGGDGSPTVTSAFSVALKPDGTLTAWGDNSQGQTNTSGVSGVVEIAAGAYHGLALRTNGTVVSWGAWKAWDTNNNVVFQTAAVPSSLTNVLGMAAAFYHDLAVSSNGAVTMWSYYTNADWLTVPSNLPPAKAVAAGLDHSVALLTNGRVVVWGDNFLGQTNMPGNLSNVVAIAAGYLHTVALKADGTVTAWGADNYFANLFGFNQGQSTVPAGLSNVVSVAAGIYYSLALKRDGTLVKWGNDVSLPSYSLNQLITIGSGWKHGLAIRGGLLTPIITAQPTNQAVLAGATTTFSEQVLTIAGTTYQWQFGGVNIPGATNATLTLSGVTTNSAGTYRVVVSNVNAGSTISSNATLTVFDVTPPVILSQSSPTNRVCIYGNRLLFSVNATAHGQTNGFPLQYQWRFNSTNILNANTNFYAVNADDNSTGIFSVLITNAVGSTNTSWSVTVTNTINVTNDLLLIYNTNSTDSKTVLDYYLAHRPNIGGANVLGLGYTNPASPNYFETITPTDLTNSILNPLRAWLTNNPAKLPQYVILFPDLPSRVNPSNVFGASYYDSSAKPSVQYQLRFGCATNWNPFVTAINMNGTNDCIGYINKLVALGTNSMTGTPLLSARANGYGNANWIFDDAGGYPARGLEALQGVTSNGVSTSAITYSISNHIYGGTNVVGYYSKGHDGGLGTNYAGLVNNGPRVIFQGNSGWYLIHTIDSYNGRQGLGYGSLFDWYSPIAFGGTNYSNTPIGAVTTVDEPTEPGKNNGFIYFGLWAAGKNFAICAWDSRNSPFFQATGDPFVTK